MSSYSDQSNQQSDPPPYSLKPNPAFHTPLNVSQIQATGSHQPALQPDQQNLPPLPPLPEDMLRSVPFPAFAAQDYIDDKKKILRKPGAWINVFLVMSGVDMAWCCFTFSYVLATWLTAVCCMILPIIGIPLYAIFALSWRALVRIELILMSNLVTDTRPSPYFDANDEPLFPELREVPHQSTRMDAGNTAIPPVPVVTPASNGYSPLTLQRSQPQSFPKRVFKMILSIQTWMAVLYFTCIRFWVSICVFLVSWVVFFPIWLLWGVFCGGFFLWGLEGGWWMVYPVVDMLASQKRLAFLLLNMKS